MAFRDDVIKDLKYEWPSATHEEPISVADSLEPSMRARFAPYFEGVHAEKAQQAFDRWLEKARKRDAELKGKGEVSRQLWSVVPRSTVVQIWGPAARRLPGNNWASRAWALPTT